MSAPLRTIVGNPAPLREELECGHVINRALGLGENSRLPPKAKRRRCWKCQEVEATKHL